MAEKKWIAGAIKHPGSLTKAAKARGQTVAGMCADAHLSAHRKAQATWPTRSKGCTTRNESSSIDMPELRTLNRRTIPMRPPMPPHTKHQHKLSNAP